MTNGRLLFMVHTCRDQLWYFPPFFFIFARDDRIFAIYCVYRMFGGGHVPNNGFDKGPIVNSIENWSTIFQNNEESVEEKKENTEEGEENVGEEKSEAKEEKEEEIEKNDILTILKTMNPTQVRLLPSLFSFSYPLSNAIRTVIRICLPLRIVNSKESDVSGIRR